MNDQFIQGIIFDWNKIDDDSYLKQIEALKDVERLLFADLFKRETLLRLNFKIKKWDF